VRVPGLSKNVEVSTAVTVMATGLQVARDLTRRVVLCSLDAGVEHPERRKFEWDAAVRAKEQRHRLVPRR
jgi:putative DNA primase/helicase